MEEQTRKGTKLHDLMTGPKQMDTNGSLVPQSASLAIKYNILTPLPLQTQPVAMTAALP